MVRIMTRGVGLEGLSGDRDFFDIEDAPPRRLLSQFIGCVTLCTDMECVPMLQALHSRSCGTLLHSRGP